MMKIDFKKDILPYLVVFAAFMVVVAVYFKPFVFDGKRVTPHDITNFHGTAREYLEFRDNNDGAVAHWTNTTFSGMPTYMIGDMPFVENNYLKYVLKVMNPFGISWPINIFIIGMLSTLLMFKSFKVNTWISAIGAFAYVFGTFFITSVEAGHNAKVEAAYLAPLIIAGMNYLFLHRRYLLGGALIAVGSGLELYASHYQITFYLFFGLLIYVVVYFFRFLKEKELPAFFKMVVILLIAGALGVFSNINKLLTVYDYSKQTIRGKSELAQYEKNATEADIEGGLDKDYAFSWSQGVGETFTILVPGLYGNSSTMELDRESKTAKGLKEKGVSNQQIRSFLKNVPMYHGNQPFTSGPIYFGALVCFMFVFSLFVVNKRVRYWLIAGTLFSFFVGWGKNFEVFNYFLFDYIPGFNKFRTVSMALYLSNLLFVIGAFLGVQKILEEKENREQFLKPLIYSGGIVGGILLIIIVSAGSMDVSAEVDKNLGWVAEYVQADRIALIKSDALRSLLIVLIGAGVLYAYIKNKVRHTVAIAIIGLVTFVDLWTIDKQYLNESKFSKVDLRKVNESNKTPADQYILQDKGYYRVFNLTRNPFTDGATAYFHNSIGGLSAAKLQRYQDVIEYHLSKNNREVLNMLNTKYIIQGPAQKDVIKNDQAFGPAWFVEKIQYVNNPMEEIQALNNKNLRSVAYMDQSKFKAGKTNFNLEGKVSVKLLENNLNSISYSTSNKNDGFVVFSEIYYPFWEAYIDGKPVDIKRVNYILRGLEVPAGNHKIEFKVQPDTYNSSMTISKIISLIVLISFVGAIGYTVFRKVKEPEEETS